jgi:type II secretory pathway component GspD/PulD (secretin)
MDILNDYISELEGERLEPSQMAMLRRPIESRLNGYRVMKAQQDKARLASGKSKGKLEEIKAQREAERLKQENVAALMKQYNALYRQHKLEEAGNIAMKARDLDPDNPVIQVAIEICKRRSRVDDAKAIRDSREQWTLDELNGVEKFPSSRVSTEGMSIDEKSRWERAKQRKPIGPFSINRYNEKEKAIERKLLMPVNLNFEHTPLKQVIDDLRDFYGINIVVDMPALRDETIHLDSPVSMKLTQVSLKSALTLILHQVHLTYVIKDEVLQITTEENAHGKLVTTTYGVADLVLNLDPGAMGQMLPGAPGAAAPGGGYVPTPVTGPLSMTTGTSVGLPMGVPSTGSQTQSIPSVNKTRMPTQEEQLISLVVNSVQPKSWQDMGGKGSIHFHPLTLALVVNQTPDIQEQIQDLLQALRRLQDQSVSVEVRMITVTEDFFERIGVNFSMNILTNKGTTDIQPSLLQGAFVTDPARFISQFQPKKLITGLTPAGTLTPNLDIPITQQSFYQTFPTYGGYTGGGLGVGLAFLSDIQLFLFMEALQGDTRANVMQAPKITCYNGQSASVNVSDTQNFLTSVSVVGLQGGQFAFQPQLTPVPNTVQLSVQPVITSDRRFVRINMNPTMQTLTPGPVPVVPVVVPIFQNIEGTPPAAGGVGQPVVFTQYVQTPRTSQIFVQTTVQVPDGGTVVMGGLKRLAEARTEYGPPVISKIPYINRLFKNVGYGRETESLLIMVSVRILILSEEELRATGFDSYNDPVVNPAAAAGAAGAGTGY